METQKCLINNVVESRQDLQVESTPPNTDNNTLTLDQSNAVREIIKSFLSPERDPTNRCSLCAKCIGCSPTELLNIEQRRNREKLSQNHTLRKCISIATDASKPGKYKIIFTLPISEQMKKDHLAKTNLNQVAKEYDHKMMKLTEEEREELHQEFQKLCDKGFYINIKTLPQKLQDDIWSSDMINFLSTAPAWKKSSMSTKFRCAHNASKKQKASGKSMNCL